MLRFGSTLLSLLSPHRHAGIWGFVVLDGVALALRLVSDNCPMALEASSHTSKFAQFTVLGIYHRQKLRIFNVGPLVEAASVGAICVKPA